MCGPGDTADRLEELQVEELAARAGWRRLHATPPAQLGSNRPDCRDQTFGMLSLQAAGRRRGAASAVQIVVRKLVDADLRLRVQRRQRARGRPAPRGDPHLGAPVPVRSAQRAAPGSAQRRPTASRGQHARSLGALRGNRQPVNARTGVAVVPSRCAGPVSRDAAATARRRVRSTPPLLVLGRLMTQGRQGQRQTENAVDSVKRSCRQRLDHPTVVLTVGVQGRAAGRRNPPCPPVGCSGRGGPAAGAAEATWRRCSTRSNVCWPRRHPKDPMPSESFSHPVNAGGRRYR